MYLVLNNMQHNSSKKRPNKARVLHTLRVQVDAFGPCRTVFSVFIVVFCLVPPAQSVGNFGERESFFHVRGRKTTSTLGSYEPWFLGSFSFSVLEPVCRILILSSSLGAPPYCEDHIQRASTGVLPDMPSMAAMLPMLIRAPPFFLV